MPAWGTFRNFRHRWLAQILVARAAFGMFLVAVPLGVSLRLLMDQREADVVLEFRDREIKLEPVLAGLISVQPVQQLLGKRADHRLLIVINHILKELVDELNFEVGEVEARIIVAIELIGEVQHDLVSLALPSRE